MFGGNQQHGRRPGTEPVPLAVGMAVALEQEMRARVVEAEAEVPRAMAEAFRQGNLGIMDYMRMKNISADTGMRESIAAHASRESRFGRPPAHGMNFECCRPD